MLTSGSDWNYNCGWTDEQSKPAYRVTIDSCELRANRDVYVADFPVWWLEIAMTPGRTQPEELAREAARQGWRPPPPPPPLTAERERGQRRPVARSADGLWEERAYTLPARPDGDFPGLDYSVANNIFLVCDRWLEQNGVYEPAADAPDAAAQAQAGVDIPPHLPVQMDVSQ